MRPILAPVAYFVGQSDRMGCAHWILCNVGSAHKRSNNEKYYVEEDAMVVTFLSKHVIIPYCIDSEAMNN